MTNQQPAKETTGLASGAPMAQIVKPEKRNSYQIKAPRFCTFFARSIAKPMDVQRARNRSATQLDALSPLPNTLKRNGFIQNPHSDSVLSRFRGRGHRTERYTAIRVTDSLQSE